MTLESALASMMKDPKLLPARRFDAFSDAFDYCRQKGHPVIVSIRDTRYKLYPSGRALVSDGGSPETWRVAL
jgi:hypothetical protein